MNDQSIALYRQVGSVFTPGSPVNERDLFAGRIDQFAKIMDATSQRGYHAVLYGDRGVGKTSLANVISNALRASGDWIVPRVNCDASDNFSTLWRKALRDILVSRSKPGMGFGADDIKESQSLVDQLPQTLMPDDIRRCLENLAKGAVLLVVFDEFDRIVDKDVTLLMADTIKSLSDFGINATVLIVGVADSVDQLIEGHQSIERALIQIPMPRMSADEIRLIIRNGLKRLSMDINSGAMGEIVSLSQGLPYITHMIALHSARAAINDDRRSINATDVDTGIGKSLDQWQQSMVVAYNDAITSSQPDNIYKEVMLACALAATDELGYFSAAAVRAPLREITGREYDIPNFAQHLKNFSEAGRGEALQRVGQTRRIRYRFSSPLMRPYVIMRGVATGLITRRKLQVLGNLKP